jgi:fucose permease
MPGSTLPPPVGAVPNAGWSDARAVRTALFVFFLSGLLMTLPGAILPAWGYHIRDEFLPIGVFFLATATGLILSIPMAPALRRYRRPSLIITVGGALGAAAFLILAFTAPPVDWPYRAFGFLVLGAGAGVLNTAAFQSILAAYDRDPAATVNLAGILFGLGSLTSALFLSSTYYVYDVRSTLILLAIVPGFAAIWHHRHGGGELPAIAPRATRHIWDDVNSPFAILFSLLLFFQFGNEWTVAGWLAVFLVRRVGVSPEDSLFMLAAYWLALIIGRVGAQALLSRMGHGRILIASSIAAVLGCVLLMLTNNTFGAWTGILMLGLGFATIYPLVVEWIGGRFPDYHPGFFNGLFSIAVTGGLLAPFLVAVAAHFWGLWVVMALPLLGTIAVLVLTLGLWIESKLHG